MNLLAGRYELLERLGRGGEAEVTRALDHETGTYVALKAIDSDRLLELPAHPALLRLIDRVTADDGTDYAVTEWVDGPNLAQLVTEAGRLRASHVATLLAPVADALDVLHRAAPPMLHGDVKPDNIVIRPDGTPVLVDIGGSTRAVGTARYVAPEVAAGGAATPASDIYALAATAFCLLTGEPPGGTKDVAAVPQPGSLAGTLRLALGAGLAVNARRRPRSATSLAGAVSPARTSPRKRADAFVGRQADLDAIEDLLAQARHVTLLGPGGSGKTRLAEEVVARLGGAWPGGTPWVDLAPAGDDDVVPELVAAAVGATPGRGQEPLDAVIACIGEAPTLLVLDNCEHLLSAVASVADAVLAACPAATVLCTSRSPLGNRGETIVPVVSLAADDAAELFSARSGHAPGDSVADICALLDHLPLAIELTAARARRRSLAGVLVDVAGSGALSAAVDASYRRLAEPDQAVLRSLAAFAGPFTAAAARAVDARASKAGLGRLVRASLVQALADGRYQLLETISAFGRERAVERGDLDVIRDAHLAWIVAWSDEARLGLAGTDGDEWITQGGFVGGEIRAAVARAQTTSPGTVVRIAANTLAYWVATGQFRMTSEWLDDALKSGALTSAERGTALITVGYLGTWLGGFADARAALAEAVAIFEAAGDDVRRFRAVAELGACELQLENTTAARRHLEAALDWAREANDEALAAGIKISLGMTAVREGAVDEARALLDEALETTRVTGPPTKLANILHTLALLAMKEGDYGRAQELHAALLPRLAGAGRAHNLASVRGNMGWVANELGDGALAATCYEDALVVFVEVNDVKSAVYCFHGLSAAALLEGDAGRAGVLSGAGEAAIAHFDVPYPDEANQWVVRWRARMEEALGRSELEAALAEGRALSYEDAVILACAP